jgi:SAM-dependent methyltransferase
MTSDEQLARDYWIRRGGNLTAAAAVHPDSRWLGYDTWTRGLLQAWTLGRVRALGPRFRRCVDLGCGFGDWTEQFAALADEVHACDISPAFAAETQRRLARHRAARVECSDIRAFALPRGADLVYVGAVLMYLADADARDVLARIRAAAAPGAVVMIRDFCAFNFGRRGERRTGDAFDIHRRPGELRALAESTGLRCVELRSSPSMYGEVLGGRALGWPLRALCRLATLPWLRASHTLVLRA